MSLYLGIVLFSFIFTSLSVIPFIDLLYRLHFTLKKPLGTTPAGGGVLLLGLMVFLYLTLYALMSRFGVYIESTYLVKDEINVLLVTFITFGLIGLLGDLQHVFNKSPNFPLKVPLLLIASISTAIMITLGLHTGYINIPFTGVIQSPVVFTLVAAAVIFFFATGAERTDAVEGLTGGSVLVAIAALWFISASHIDTPISLFISLWIGTLIAFLYFNVYPARILLGQTGANAFGAMLGLIALLLGKPFTLLLICSPFVIANLVSLFHIPLDAWFKERGWPESKIMMRGWLITLLTAAIGLWLA